MTTIAQPIILGIDTKYTIQRLQGSGTLVPHESGEAKALLPNCPGYFVHIPYFLFDKSLKIFPFMSFMVKIGAAQVINCISTRKTISCIFRMNY
jgi:hypothetical protein